MEIPDHRSLKATEHKDRAYAMLWFFDPDNENLAPLLEVDYTKSIETIYTEYTAALLLEGDNIGDQVSKVLSTVYGNRRNHRLPWWVPDWTESSDGFGKSLFALPEFEAGGEPYGAGVEARGAVLYALGRIVGSILNCVR